MSCIPAVLCHGGCGVLLRCAGRAPAMPSPDDDLRLYRRAHKEPRPGGGAPAAAAALHIDHRQQRYHLAACITATGVCAQELPLQVGEAGLASWTIVPQHLEPRRGDSVIGHISSACSEHPAAAPHRQHACRSQSCHLARVFALLSLRVC